MTAAPDAAALADPVTVTGPYHYVGDVRPVFRLNGPDRLFGTVEVHDETSEEMALRIAGFLNAALRTAPPASAASVEEIAKVQAFIRRFRQHFLGEELGELCVIADNHSRLPKDCAFDYESAAALAILARLSAPAPVQAEPTKPVTFSGLSALLNAQPTGERVAALPDDLFSHESAWRSALEIAKEHAEVSRPDLDDKSYWDHELRAFDRTWASLRALSPHKPEERGDAVRRKTLKAAAKLCDVFSEKNSYSASEYMKGRCHAGTELADKLYALARSPEPKGGAS